jgi:hypothetical protein
MKVVMGEFKQSGEREAGYIPSWAVGLHPELCHHGNHTARYSGELLKWPAPLGRTVSSIFVPRHDSQTLMGGTESNGRTDWTKG